jgi:hypothetical protein
VATGRPNTATEDWEFRYHGHLTGPRFPVPDWVKIPINQHPTLVGSVIKLGAAWGNVGEVFSFIAVKQPGQPDGVSGLWNYRTVNNNPELIYRGNWHIAPFETPSQPAPEIISQEAEFTLGTSQKEGITTLQGSASGTGWLQTGWGTFTLKLNGRVFEQGGDEPPNFILEGSSFQSLGEDGGEFGYRGQLTRHWEKGVGQRPALVGDVIRYGKKSTWNHPNTWPEYRSDLQPPLPDGYVTPFIAVKR